MKNNKRQHYIFSLLTLSALLFIPEGLVWAKGQMLRAKTIENMGKQFMLDTLAWDGDRMELKVTYEGKDLMLPNGNITFDCKLPGGNKRVGSVQFMCFVKVNEILKKRLRLNAMVKVVYDIFRPTRPLKMGHRIKQQDVEKVQIKSDRVMRNLITDPNEIIGYRLLTNLDKGDPLLNHMLQRVPLVKSGDRILIVAQKGSLRVTAPGVVRENGFKNDTIRVENIHSHKMVYGTVIDSRTVHINF